MRAFLPGALLILTLALLAVFATGFVTAAEEAGSAEHRLSVAAKDHRIENDDFETNVAVRLFLGDNLVISLEYGCPPPGNLACGSGLRLRIKPDLRPSLDASRTFGNLAIKFLNDVGFTDLETAHSAFDGSSGEIVEGGEYLLVEGGENLLRWKQQAGVLEAVTSKLELRPKAKLPPRSGYQDEPRRIGPVGIEVDPEILSLVLRNLTLPARQ